MHTYVQYFTIGLALSTRRNHPVQRQRYAYERLFKSQLHVIPVKAFQPLHMRMIAHFYLNAFTI